jgi:hypothetical protein
MIAAVAEIIDFHDIVRARTRRRTRALTVCCLDVMEACLTETRHAYDAASPAERQAWGAKIRQLEGLMDYAATWL